MFFGILFQLPSSPRVHIVDMKDPYKTTLSVARKRKLPCESPLLPSRFLPQSPAPSKASLGKGSSQSLTDDIENVPVFTSPELQRKKASKTAHSPVFVTPDRRFEKPTAFISPITRSMTKVPKSLQVNNLPKREFCDFLF